MKLTSILLFLTVMACLLAVMGCEAGPIDPGATSAGFMMPSNPVPAPVFATSPLFVFDAMKMNIDYANSSAADQSFLSSNTPKIYASVRREHPANSGCNIKLSIWPLFDHNVSIALLPKVHDTKTKILAAT